MLFQNPTWATAGMVAASLGLTLVMMSAVIYGLVIKRDKWARKLIAKDIDLDQQPSIDLTLIMAFRLISVGAGLYCLNTFVWSFSSMVMVLIQTINYARQEGTVQYFTGGFSVNYVLPILYLALAIYLLCGAPHFVRWQVKKTMQFCNQQGDLNKDQQH